MPLTELVHYFNKRNRLVCSAADEDCFAIVDGQVQARFRGNVLTTLFQPVVERASGHVIGRDYEFLISRTGSRIALTAMNMHDDIFDGLLAVQFRQHKPGVVECYLQPTPSWSRDREVGIRGGLLRKLGDDFDLTLRAVDEIEKTSAGKHRWLVTTLKP